MISFHHYANDEARERYGTEGHYGTNDVFDPSLMTQVSSERREPSYRGLS